MYNRFFKDPRYEFVIKYNFENTILDRLVESYILVTRVDKIYIYFCLHLPLEGAKDPDEKTIYALPS